MIRSPVTAERNWAYAHPLRVSYEYKIKDPNDNVILQCIIPEVDNNTSFTMYMDPITLEGSCQTSDNLSILPAKVLGYYSVIISVVPPYTGAITPETMEKFYLFEDAPPTPQIIGTNIKCDDNCSPILKEDYTQENSYYLLQWCCVYRENDPYFPGTSLPLINPPTFNIWIVDPTYNNNRKVLKIYYYDYDVEITCSETTKMFTFSYNINVGKG